MMKKMLLMSLALLSVAGVEAGIIANFHFKKLKAAQKIHNAAQTALEKAQQTYNTAQTAQQADGTTQSTQREMPLVSKNKFLHAIGWGNN